MLPECYSSIILKGYRGCSHSGQNGIIVIPLIVRFTYDAEKGRKLKQKRGRDFVEIQEIFFHTL